MRLNLGCCDSPKPGYVNVDLRAYPGVDVVHDLSNFPWPWDDSSVDEIYASHIIEHIADRVGVMNECWRVLKPGGRLSLIYPDAMGAGHWQDPDHKGDAAWTLNSLMYYEHGNPHNARFRATNGIKCAYTILSKERRVWEPGRGWDPVPIIHAELEAVK